MNDVLAAPSPTASIKRAAARIWEDPESRSVAIGIAAVLLVHLILILTAPVIFGTGAVNLAARKKLPPKEFNIEIAPDTFAKPLPKPPPPSRYVEANPNAPDNVPDKTNNFSFQNQQAAQEKPQADQHNDRARTDGKKDIQSNQVVSGQLSKPQPVVPVSPEKVAQTKPQAVPRRQENPLTGFEKLKDTPDGDLGSNVAKTIDDSKPIPDPIKGATDAPLVQSTDTTEPAIDPHHPRARPILEHIQTRPAVFQDNQFGTSNIGLPAFDAKWSNYGAYLHKMLEAIQTEWDRILTEKRNYPNPGTSVTVKFTLDKKGAITAIINVDSTAGDEGTRNCASAIATAAPYGEWTDDMVAALGDSTDLTIIFYYQ